MLDDYVRYHAELNGNATALLIPQGRVSFRKLEADLRRMVWELGDLKVEPNKSVRIVVGNSYFHWLLNLALARLGVASALPSEVDSPFCITDDPDVRGDKIMLLSKEQIRNIVRGSERPLTRVKSDPEALGRIFCTSGTTGAPKRIAFSWRGLTANV